MICPSVGIVVTGFSAVTAAGNGIAPILELIRTGGDALSPIPAEIAGREGYRWGKATGFKSSEFIPPLKARKLDRCSQFAVAASGLALKDACIDVNVIDPGRIGIVLGCGFGGVANSAEFLTGYFRSGAEGLAPMLFPNTVSNAPASNASIEHGLKGPNATQVQRFCSAESAFMLACRFLAEGRADVMLTGGADDLTPLMIKAFAAMGQLNGHASAFGEGSGILVLESGAHAASRGATIRGAVGNIRTVGMLLPGREAEGIGLLTEGMGNCDLASLSGAPDALPELAASVSMQAIDTGACIGRSLAMGGTAMATLLASLSSGRRGIHLAISPEGPYFAIEFTGGATV